MTLINQAKQIIEKWNSSAASYEQLLKHQPIFSSMASRLIDLVSATNCESIIDLGGGFG